jgi:asparagine synthase (glutamine-hydrolysing)
VSSHESGAGDHSAALWALLMFEAFLRNVVDSGARRSADAREPQVVVTG